MSQVARYGKSVAKAGRGAELAELLLEAAAAMEDDPACQLYLINRQADEPDVIWVTELWRSQDELDAVVAKVRGSADVGAVMDLVESWEMIELDLLGGKQPVFDTTSATSED